MTTMEWQRFIFLCVIGAIFNVMVIPINEGVMTMKGIWWRIFYRKGRDADRE
jgi:hypothetical protein